MHARHLFVCLLVACGAPERDAARPGDAAVDVAATDAGRTDLATDAGSSEDAGARDGGPTRIASTTVIVVEGRTATVGSTLHLNAADGTLLEAAKTDDVGAVHFDGDVVDSVTIPYSSSMHFTTLFGVERGEVLELVFPGPIAERIVAVPENVPGPPALIGVDNGCSSSPTGASSPVELFAWGLCMAEDGTFDVLAFVFSDTTTISWSWASHVSIAGRAQLDRWRPSTLIPADLPQGRSISPRYEHGDRTFRSRFIVEASGVVPVPVGFAERVGVTMWWREGGHLFIEVRWFSVSANRISATPGPPLAAIRDARVVGRTVVLSLGPGEPPDVAYVDVAVRGEHGWTLIWPLSRGLTIPLPDVPALIEGPFRVSRVVVADAIDGDAGDIRRKVGTQFGDLSRVGDYRSIE